MNPRAFGTIALTLALAFSSGCGGDGRYGVTGTVKYKGEPVKAGTISFLSEGGGAPEGGSSLKDGAYEVHAQPGLKPGKYKVSISAPDPKAPAVKVEDTPGVSGPTPKEYLPAEYNASTKLTAEVKAGKNVIDFDLK